MSHLKSMYQPGDLVRIKYPKGVTGPPQVFPVHGVSEKGVQVRVGGTDEQPEWRVYPTRQLVRMPGRAR